VPGISGDRSSEVFSLSSPRFRTKKGYDRCMNFSKSVAAHEAYRGEWFLLRFVEVSLKKKVFELFERKGRDNGNNKKINRSRKTGQHSLQSVDPV
jgi:hypothetical protein